MSTPPEDVDSLLDRLNRRPVAPPPHACAPKPWLGMLKVRQLDPNGWEFGSGTVLNTPRQDVVCTAAHVVHEPGARIVPEESVFMPGYVDGQTPYGAIPLARIYVPPEYVADPDFGPDYAFVKLSRPAPAAMDVSFGNLPTRTEWFPRVTLFGYPVADPSDPRVPPMEQSAPVNGMESMLRGDFDADPDAGVFDVATTTGFLSGGSGGPVVRDYADPSAGTVIGVVATAIGDPVRMNGLSIFNPSAAALFQLAVNGDPPPQ